MQHTPGLLEEAGYIEYRQVDTATPGAATQPAAPALAVTAFGELPAMHDPVRFQLAKNFMVNTLNAFVGTLGTSSLLDRIEMANDHVPLRALFNEWFRAITMSRTAVAKPRPCAQNCWL